MRIVHCYLEQGNYVIGYYYILQDTQCKNAIIDCRKELNNYKVLFFTTHKKE